MNKRVKSLILVALMIIAMMSFAGCKDDADIGIIGGADGPTQIIVADKLDNTIIDTNVYTAELSIDYPDDSGLEDLEDVEIIIVDGTTVLEALTTYAKANNLVVSVEQGVSPYVTNIGGVTATDDTGWVFEVNDEMVMVSAGELVLKDGDEVDWEFVTWDEVTM